VLVAVTVAATTSTPTPAGPSPCSSTLRPEICELLSSVTPLAPEIVAPMPLIETDPEPAFSVTLERCTPSDIALLPRAAPVIVPPGLAAPPVPNPPSVMLPPAVLMLVADSEMPPLPPRPASIVTGIGPLLEMLTALPMM
jgi:hypothetical protein